MNTRSTSETILDQLLSIQSGLGFCWLGNDGWLIRSRQRLIAFDPDLRVPPSRLQKSPVSAEEMAPSLDVVFISHRHGDHFQPETAAILAAKSKCIFVVPANSVDRAKSAGVPDDRIVLSRPREKFDLMGMEVLPTRAFHGARDQTVFTRANLDDCGYLLTIDGFRLFQPGDSVLTEDHLALADIDILFVSPTSHNMHIRPASLLIETLRPRWIFPQHFDTYPSTPDNDFWTVGYPDELRGSLPPELQHRFHKLNHGEVFIIEGK